MLLNFTVFSKNTIGARGFRTWIINCGSQQPSHAAGVAEKEKKKDIWIKYYLKKNPKKQEFPLWLRELRTQQGVHEDTGPIPVG